MPNLVQIRREVWDLLGRPYLTTPDGVDDTNSRLNAAINEALLLAQRLAPFPPAIQVSTTLNFATNQASVPLPVRYREVVTVVRLGPIPQPLVRGEYHLLLRSLGNTTGTPLNYSIYGPSLYLFPIPTVATSVQFDYLQWLPPLSADTDSNWYTDYAYDFIRYKAAGLLARRMMAADEVQVFETYAVEALQALQAAVLSERAADAPRTMRTVGAVPPPPPGVVTAQG